MNVMTEFFMLVLRGAIILLAPIPVAAIMDIVSMQMVVPVMVISLIYNVNGFVYYNFYFTFPLTRY